MSDFKITKSLGLEVFARKELHGDDSRWVNARYLEDLLSLAQVVKCYIDKRGKGPWYDNETNCPATHTAFLLGVTPIKKKTKVERISEAMNDIAKPIHVVMMEIKDILNEKGEE